MPDTAGHFDRTDGIELPHLAYWHRHRAAILRLSGTAIVAVGAAASAPFLAPATPWWGGLVIALGSLAGHEALCIAIARRTATDAAAPAEPRAYDPPCAHAPETRGDPALAEIRIELKHVGPYTANLCLQLSGVKGDVATGVMAAMEQVNVLHGDSRAQREAIDRSIASGALLASAVRRPAPLIAELRAEMARQDALTVAGAERANRLAQQLLGLSPIVDTIAKIAHRTQILSFNAAIEAGIAGEHGRAFTVVADEVRNLAKSVDQAVVQAADLIERSTRSAKLDLAEAKAGKQGAAGDLSSLVGELEVLQQELSTSSHGLLAVIDIVEAGHGKIVNGLSNVLGHLQFDDVVRQRLDQVADDLRDLSANLLERAEAGHGGSNSLTALMERNKDRYVMESQVLTHQAALSGGESAVSGGGAAIELF